MTNLSFTVTSPECEAWMERRREVSRQGGPPGLEITVVLTGGLQAFRRACSILAPLVLKFPEAAPEQGTQGPWWPY